MHCHLVPNNPCLRSLVFSCPRCYGKVHLSILFITVFLLLLLFTFLFFPFTVPSRNVCAKPEVVENRLSFHSLTMVRSSSSCHHHHQPAWILLRTSTIMCSFPRFSVTSCSILTRRSVTVFSNSASRSKFHRHTEMEAHHARL